MPTDHHSRGESSSTAPTFDAERNADEDLYSDGDNEETPLLPTDLPSDILPKKSFQRMVVMMGMLALIVITVSQSLLSPAVQEILEDVICRKVYHDHQLGLFNALDNRCKDNRVQKTLAMVKAWDASAQMYVPMVVQVLYGIIADKYGRKIVLFLALFGCTLQITWQLTVLWFPTTFNVWYLLYGNIAFLIGGGGQVAVAMIYTIFSDTVPVAQRTIIFYQVHAVLQIVTVAATPLAATLLGIDPWLAVWIAYGLWIFGTTCILFVPETLTLRQKADDRMRSSAASGAQGDQAESERPVKKLTFQSMVQQAMFSIRDDMSHIWRFLLGSKGIMLLIISNGFYFPVRTAFNVDLLQYITKRFNWTWSTATYVLSIEHLAAVVVLMAILPAASWSLGRVGYAPLRRDLTLARASLVFAFVGTVIIAVAPFGALCIIALVIFSFGSGFPALFRALICAVVEPHTLGTLNTAIAMTESLMGLVSSPALGWLLSKGIDLGGGWMGLPFMVSAALVAVVTALLFIFRLPAAFEKS